MEENDTNGGLKSVWEMGTQEVNASLRGQIYLKSYKKCN